jgi:DtxR family Mn-dependent transcriptional regulator
MTDPLSALIGFAMLVAALLVLTWPRVGVVARMRRGRVASERVTMEDALKHLFKCEYAGQPWSVESLAGALEISRAQASETLARLQDRGLVRLDDGDHPLTDEGRSYALRIIRTHRLWERFLADRTGVEPADWHDRAERREHEFTPQAVEALAARLGHPRYDPHGDPIPTASGEMPERVGVALTSLGEGDEGLITHLEDEPEEIYQRLLELGLALHMPVRIRGVDPAGWVRFETDGRAVALDPMAARNVTVLRRPVAPDRMEGAESLSALRQGEEAEVLGIIPACQGTQRRRLLDLGVVPGTRVAAELGSAAGDPMAYRIRGALIALRAEQASWIRIQRVPVSSTPGDRGEAA